MEDVIGIPTNDQALACVVGGDREYEGEAKQQIADKIIDSATAHQSWREGLPFEQQIALKDVPTVTFPRGDSANAEADAHAGV